MRIDRLNNIEQYVIKHGSASLEELASCFDISMNTVRRDVKELLDRGALEKVYGGVAIKSNPVGTGFQPMSIRAGKNNAEKQIIGQLAASLVEDKTSIFLDAGSTTPAILPYLSQKKDVTVVTHSLSALCEASKYPNLNVIALGGMYYPHTSSYVGISTLDSLERMRINTVFMAATGVSLTEGVTNSTFLEAEVKTKVAKCGGKIVLMADHTKFDSAAALTVCSLDDLYCVVTDREPSKPYLDRFKKAGVRLLCPEK